MTRGQQPSAGRSGVAWRALLAALVLSLAVLPGRATPLAAAQSQLTNGAVTPGSGTTATTFTFTVHYTSSQGAAPTSVTAVVGSVVVAMTLAAGAPGDGDYRGTAMLPAGSWAVTFQATGKGFDPTLAGPTVTVTQVQPAPPPTPRPTTAPTPAPTSQPTQPTPRPSVRPAATPLGATPLPATPSASPVSASPVATPQSSGFVGGVVATPRASGSPQPGISPSPGEPRGQLTTVLVGAGIALGVLAILGVIALLRRRREPATAVDARLALLPPEAREAPSAPAAAAPRPRAAWEDYDLENQPIGTVEYEPPPSRADG